MKNHKTRMLLVVNVKVGKNCLPFQSIFTNYIVKLISDFSFLDFHLSNTLESRYSQLPRKS